MLMSPNEGETAVHGCVRYWPGSGLAIASHARVFRGARLSSLPANACSTENNIPFPNLANHIVLSKFWKFDLDRRVIRKLLDLYETLYNL